MRFSTSALATAPAICLPVGLVDFLGGDRMFASAAFSSSARNASSSARSSSKIVEVLA